MEKVVCNSSIINNDQKTNTLTRFQLRSARAIVGIDRSAFRYMIGVEKGILEYAESFNNNEYINPEKMIQIQRYKINLANMAFTSLVATQSLSRN